MDGFMKYLLQNYHILGILLIVTIIAIKLFMTTRQAKKMLAGARDNSKIDNIITRLDRIERMLVETKNLKS